VQKLQFLDLNQLMATLNVPVPFTLQAILGCQVDRLTHIQVRCMRALRAKCERDTAESHVCTQRMMLKVAAVIGEEFTFDTVFAAYPLQHSVCRLARRAGAPRRRLCSRVAGWRRAQEEDKPVFEQQLKQLEAMNIIRVVRGGGAVFEGTAAPAAAPLLSPTGAGPAASAAPSEPAVYVFCNGFLRDMLLSRMLEEQKAR
jgi:hypothetical protein